MYRYFDSKEALFTADLADESARRAAAIAAMVDPATENPRTALRAFGLTYLNFVLVPVSLSAVRIGVESRNE